MGGAPATGSGPGSPAASCTGEGPTSPTCLLPVLMRAQPHATKHRNPASTCLPSLPTGLLRGLLPWFCLGLALALPGLQPCSAAHTLSAAHAICGSGPQGFPLSTEFLPEGKVSASCVRQTVPALPSPPPPRLPCPARFQLEVWVGEESLASLRLSCLPAPCLLLGLCMLGQVHVARQQVKDKVQKPQTCWGARSEVLSPLTSVLAFTHNFQHYCPSQVTHCSLNRYTKHPLMSGGPVAGAHPQSCP